MADLVERLLAAIAVKEQKARAALGEAWDDSAEERVLGDGEWTFEGGIDGPRVRIVQTGEDVAACLLDDFEHTRMSVEHVEHIAENDPRSVLRLCQAHREIIEQYRRASKYELMAREYWGLHFAVMALAGGYGIQEEASDGK